jgi:hypothetical protein
MREIKFRAYCEFDKTWHYWNVYGEYPQGIYGGLIWSWAVTLMSSPSEPQQYTGLKDKNGKEIYEGDIVRYRQHMFNTEKTRTKEKEIGFDRFSGCFNVYETNAGQDEHEVIGNIFEGVDK